MVSEDLLAEDIPKFQELLQSLSKISDDIAPQLCSLSQRVKDGDLTVANGVSLLDVKYQSLLSYVLDLITVILHKVNGVSISESEAINRIVEFRTVLEKIRPLEQKLKYQIDKVIQTSTNAAVLSENDPLKFKPNLNNFLDSEEDSSDEDVSGIPKKYVPPHIAAVKLEEGKKQANMNKARERALAKSSIISELIEETSELPTEYFERSTIKARALKERSERQKFEEENFVRVTVTKKQRSKEKNVLRKSELETIANFGNNEFLHDERGNIQTTKKRKAKSSGKRGKSKKRKFKR